jgi:hypothetical protein
MKNSNLSALILQLALAMKQGTEFKKEEKKKSLKEEFKEAKAKK